MTLGIRVHPKYALRVGVIYSTDDADLTTFYSHDLRSLQELSEFLKSDGRFFDPLGMEEWDGTEWRELL